MSFKEKTILVTGATGLIGYNLVCRLLNEGAKKVYATGRSINKLRTTFEEYQSDVLELIEHDAAAALPNSLHDIDFIFHAAGPMERDIVQNRPVDVILPNLIGLINCFEYLREQEILTGRKGRIIVFSSVTVYNNPTEDDYVATEDVTNYASSLDLAASCYSESKRMCEVIAKSYSKQYGIDAVIARFSTVYGYTINIPNTAFFEFINKALNGQDIVLNGIGMPRRDNIYVDDAIEGLLLIANKGISGESYNISSNGDKDNFAAVDEIAEQIAQEAATIQHKPAVKVIKPVSTDKRKPGLKLSNKKLKELGWEVKTQSKQGIASVIRLKLSNTIMQ